MLELFESCQVQIDTGTLDREGAFEHFACLPLFFVPLLGVDHVMILLVPSPVVNEPDLPFIHVESLGLRVDPALGLDLRHCKPHRADLIAALELHLDHLLIANVSLVVLTDEHDPARSLAQRLVKLDCLCEFADQFVYVRVVILVDW